MKPFNPNEPVQCRNGDKARIICTDRAGECPIVALIGEREFLATFSADGQSYTSRNDYLDLINIPVQRTGWVNISSGGYGAIYPTKEGADRCRYGDTCASVQVTWTPGEGL